MNLAIFQIRNDGQLHNSYAGQSGPIADEPAGICLSRRGPLLARGQRLENPCSRLLWFFAIGPSMIDNELLSSKYLSFIIPPPPHPFVLLFPSSSSEHDQPVNATLLNFDHVQ